MVFTRTQAAARLEIEGRGLIAEDVGVSIGLDQVRRNAGQAFVGADEHVLDLIRDAEALLIRPEVPAADTQQQVLRQQPMEFPDALMFDVVCPVPVKL